jgi:hypothetical protein
MVEWFADLKSAKEGEKTWHGKNKRLFYENTVS